MAENVETYLKELQAAMAGADPALIQDALFDAEEHLRSEMASRGFGTGSGTATPAEAAAFAEVAEAYGTPGEVAAAYLDEAAAEKGAIPAHLVPPAGQGGAAAGSAEAAPPPRAAATSRPWWRSFFGVVTEASAYKALLYMLLSLATGIAYFTIVVTGLSLSGSLIILIIGVPILLLFLGVVRGLSFLEGRLIETLLDTRMPRRPRAEIQGAGLVERVLFWLKDARTWLAMVYMLLMLPLGLAYFTIAVSGIGTALWMIAIPFVQLASDHSFLNIGTSEFLFPVWSMPLLVIGGALLFVASMHVFRWIARGHAAFAKAMLVRLAK